MSSSETSTHVFKDLPQPVEEKDKEREKDKESREVTVKSYWWPQQSNIDIREVEKGFHGLLPDTIRKGLVMLIPVVSMVLYLEREQLALIYASVMNFLMWIHLERNFLFYELSFFVAITTVAIWFMTKPKGVYLIDFAVWSGNSKYQVSNQGFVDLTRESGFFSQESIDFQDRMSKRTGLGDQTYLPPGILARPPETNMNMARDEAATIIFDVIESLLARTGIKPTDIDILIVNCSLFCPTPSLASMVVNKYKMRSNILSFNLGGMGCSAGVIAIDLAKDLLQVHKDSLALVVSTENITLNWYRGNERALMLQNALFRCGGAAIMLTNKWSESWRCKYQLMHTVRVHKGASEPAYNSVYQLEDEYMNKGIRLSKDLMNVVGDALKSNMTVLGPLVLPWSEQIKFFANYIVSRLCKRMGKKPPAPYVPDFKKAFQHFCIHAGGRAIIDGLEENLKLSARNVEPSRATLYRYGNTSSSSVWYELAYSERMGYIKSGHSIWQIALGSGFKCNSAVWKALKSFEPIQPVPDS
jgi:3-ketoacyl-CoA synthase